MFASHAVAPSAWTWSHTRVRLADGDESTNMDQAVSPAIHLKKKQRKQEVTEDGGTGHFALVGPGGKATLR